MSFMFKPYRYTDPLAVNHINFSQELTDTVVLGNDAIAQRLIESTPSKGVLYIDGYVGAMFEPLLKRIREFSGSRRLCLMPLSQCYKDSEEMEKMLAETLPTDRIQDPILLFGKLISREIASLFDKTKKLDFINKIRQNLLENDLVVVYGQGAALKDFQIAGSSISAFIDVTPLETTLRIRSREIRNLGDAEEFRSIPQIFRRMYYYDYEIMMLHRQQLMQNKAIDFYIDGNMNDRLKMLPLASVVKAFDCLMSTPFRCTPVYIEGVWGGKFVKNLRHLPEDMKNCAWVFDMIPNEVSVQVRIGSSTFNFPFSTLFKLNAESLMGTESVKRFGRVFPIRFNYDDTYGGSGNMSIQVHPPKEYNNEHFGEPFQQDESYYCVKTAGSKTYLGLQDDCNVDEFFACIDNAEKKHVPFDHDKYVNSFPSTEGDQFLLPGGTIHASGRNQIVLEIGSYTIGSYTFKLYDYLRKDLDGNPRPIHSFHGKNVLNTSRRRTSIDGVLRPKPRIVREGEGWKEEIVGEHDLIYFSLRRFSFTHSIDDNTQNEKFHVLVLVNGERILVQSKSNPKMCYYANYMDMIVVPASLGEYTIINLGSTPCQVTKTLLK